MAYPSLAEIEKADRVQLATWVRDLPPPGSGMIGAGVAGDGRLAFSAAYNIEYPLLDRIIARLESLGGMPSEIGARH